MTTAIVARRHWHRVGQPKIAWSVDLVTPSKIASTGGLAAWVSCYRSHGGET